ncbi:RNA-guided endonuclease InsQ/TnpB family protein [Streptosporangium lutulentum]|uniref:Transposase n=1 Tax=Streptosporangium lutulentum TaxID=1461250 RepID=A0ABT9QG98_9ACTN|nr:RNA-guided endonuclease TnpB family protein [Streptosporangium lutulentum]MDP9845786.1 putative transposase [Streptosporangium lutulentum]
MQLRYNYRMYPNASQRQALARAFGCARTVFNDGLRARIDAHEQGLPYLSDGDLSKRVITQAKLTPQRSWLGEVSAVVLQQALADLNTAYRNFFSSLSGKRKGPKVAPPRFKSRKDTRQAVRFTKNARFAVTTAGKLRLPKIGDVDVRWSRSLPSDPSSVTVVKDAVGRYFASFVVETTDEPLPTSPNAVGIDLGLTHFAVLSDGRKVANPRFLRRAAKKLRKAQKALSRALPGSANRKKATLKVARAHARVSDMRNDWAHQLSTTIIRENQAVYVEDLAVSALGRTKMARSVHDAAWSRFVTMLEYKAVRHGRTFAKIGRWFPSSRLCSACGIIAASMPLQVREWTCSCGAIHDRDVNAAINIKTEGARIVAAGRKPAAGTRREAETLNACGDRVRPLPAVAQVEEAGSRRGAA